MKLYIKLALITVLLTSCGFWPVPAQAKVTLLRLVKGYSHVKQVVFSPDSQNMAVHADGTVSLWNVAAGKRLWSRELPDSPTGYGHPITYSPDGKVVAGLFDPHTISLWNAENGAPLKKIAYPKDNLHTLQFSPHGRFLVCAGEKSIVLWSMQRQRWIAAYHCAHSDRDGYEMALSPDGKLLAASCSYNLDEESGSGELDVWDLVSGRLLHRFNQPDNVLTALTFSPKGRTLAAGFSGVNDAQTVGVVHIWEMPSGHRVSVLAADENDANLGALAYSPDGKLLATGCQSDVYNEFTVKGRVRVWSLRTKTQQLLHGHNSLVNTVAFSPNGKLLASGSDEDGLRLWRVAP